MYSEVHSTIRTPTRTTNVINSDVKQMRVNRMPQVECLGDGTRGASHAVRVYHNWVVEWVADYT